MRNDLILRQFIREALRQGASGPGITADPTTGTSGGARDYDLERGVDIHGYWYKSPGDKGSSDPMRPDDPEEYIGIKPKAPAEGEAGGEEPVV